MSEAFKMGDEVYSLFAPHGQAGRVVAIRNKWIVVDWPDLEFRSKHRPEALIPAPSAGTSQQTPQKELQI